jgi:hypothetical protein
MNVLKLQTLTPTYTANGGLVPLSITSSGIACCN